MLGSAGALRFPLPLALGAAAALGTVVALAAGPAAGRERAFDASGVRCGPATGVGSGVFRVRDGAIGLGGTVQAVYVGGSRSSIEIRVCRDDGATTTAFASVVDAGRPWRELVVDRLGCEDASGSGSDAISDYGYETRAQRQRRIRAAVRRGTARVRRLADGRHYVVDDRQLPVPTSATIGSRRWLADCRATGTAR